MALGDSQTYWTIPIISWGKNIQYLLDVSQTPSFKDSRLFLYYIYSLILGGQAFLQKLKVESLTNYSVKYAKNLYKTQKEYEELKLNINFTISRFQAYETIIKQIFNIQWMERNIKVISNQFPTYENITPEQFQKLNDFIIGPLFKGDFSKMPPNIEIPILDCVAFHAIEWVPATCRQSYLKKFPFPLFDKEKPPKHGNFDIIMPLVFYNSLLIEQKRGDEIIRTWYGMLDQSLQVATGLVTGNGFNALRGVGDEPTNYVVNVGEKINNAGESVGDFLKAVTETGKELLQALYDAIKALREAANSAAAGGSAVVDGALLSGAAAILFMGYNFFFNEK